VWGADCTVAALTIAIEIVANANGSPTMCPKLNLPPRRWSIILGFCSDGEWSEP
jgi:hypothetical protein